MASTTTGRSTSSSAAPASAISSYHGKTAIIAGDLRQAIIRGDFAPGDRLPTRTELADRYGVSNLTVQRALDLLTRDGFVVARVRLGTFVTAQPPHLSHYALLFPTTQDDRQQNLFSVTLARCAGAAGDGATRFSVYWGFAGRDGFEGYDRLLQDVSASRVAGLIFASAPFQLRGSPLLTLPDVPRTAFMSASMSGMPVVTMHSGSFLKKAAERLREMGRRRVAVLVIAQRSDQYVREARRILCGYDLECPDAWVQAAPLDRTHWAGALAKLLWSMPRRQRPDGLIVTDQNHAAPVVAGLTESGCRLPRDMAVISHCNFPLQTDADLPVTWVGYDVGEGLRQCVRNIDDQRAGRSPVQVTRLKARFAGDVQS